MRAISSEVSRDHFPFEKHLGALPRCFIAEETLEQLPAPTRVGKTKAGGIDFNRARMRWVAQAVLALSPSPRGFTASQLAEQVRRMTQQDESQYGYVVLPTI